MTTLAYSTPAARGASDTRAVAYWLLFCAAMVFAMAVIGAITRLTESGLSMVEWEPLIGAIPPLNEAEWQRVFDLYRQTPEYRLKNFGMDLAGFKEIFFWEWFHRLWGRLIGLVFALPLIWFWLSGRLARARVAAPGLGWKLIGLFVLGAAQGALGWYMVMSGLVDRPSVSHYRLAAHLGLACLIYVLLLWLAVDLLRPAAAGDRERVAARGLLAHAWVTVAMVSITMVWGAFVAGLDAGVVYNTFPLMDGRFLPPESWTLNPWWLNALDNTALVQFMHRWLAVSTALVAIALCFRGLRPGAPASLRKIAGALGIMVVVQVLLGVSTLLLAVPVPLGAAHQAGALAVLGLAVLMVQEAKR